MEKVNFYILSGAPHKGYRFCNHYEVGDFENAILEFAILSEFAELHHVICERPNDLVQDYCRGQEKQYHHLMMSRSGKDVTIYFSYIYHLPNICAIYRREKIDLNIKVDYKD